MTSRRELEKRLGDLSGSPDDLPLASLAEIIAADDMSETGRDNVVLLDGQPHYSPPLTGPEKRTFDEDTETETGGT